MEVDVEVDGDEKGDEWADEGVNNFVYLTRLTSHIVCGCIASGAKINVVATGVAVLRCLDVVGLQYISRDEVTIISRWGGLSAAPQRIQYLEECNTITINREKNLE